MKKSVVIPYERYQQLMQNQRGAAASALVNHQEIKKLPPLDGAEESKPQIHKLDSSVIVACLPKRNRSKAQQILEYIDKHSQLDWNKQGNLVVDNNSVEYSHVVDLIHDALNPTKHDPVGYESFYRQLQHVPRSLITNPRRKSLIGRGQLPPPGLPATEPKPLNIWKERWKAV